MNVKHIFLFGHRKQHGKDSSCDVFEEILKNRGLEYHRTFFAKLLKQTCCLKYGLDYDKLNDDEYKNSIPEHIPPVKEWFNAKTQKMEYNVKLTVRQILVEDGTRHSRKIWDNVWSNACYTEVFQADKEIAMISDFRFPHESTCVEEILSIYCKNNNIDINKIELPKVHKILVHRPDGIFISDGADDQLPDPDCILDPQKPDYWDYMIINDSHDNNWKSDNLYNQVLNMFDYCVNPTEKTKTCVSYK